MRSGKIFYFSIALIVCLLILIGGCAPTRREAAVPQTALIALKLVPQDSTKYRVTTEAQRTVKWDGPLPNDVDSRQNRKCTKAEFIFTEQIQSSDDKGNAVAKITLEDLKYSSTIKGNTALDFDSSRDKTSNNPFAKLVGKSYTIEIAPTGEVIKVIDVNEALAAVKGQSSDNEMVLALLSPEAIKERHGVIVLPPTGKNQLRIGDNWSDIKTFSFRFMGSKSYEKIYTVKEIKDANNHWIAVVDMNAIPSTKMAEQLHKEQTAASLSETFDSTGAYTGSLEFDLTAGKIEKYLEKLQLEWIAVDPNPSTGRKVQQEPAALRLGAIRSYSLEKID